LFGIVTGPKSRHIGFRPSTSSTESDNIELPPLVIDADGLNALAQAEDWWSCLPENTILTPHPGEMSRLTGLDTQVVTDDRVGMAIEYAGKWGHIVVLKGAFTVIAAPDGHAAVLPFANPALATAGTGDVLAGAIAGLLAQGMAPFDAATCGAYLHGLAGQIAAEQTGIAGMLASDLLQEIPKAMIRVRHERRN
jgi:NAD(P)H-hydrate epimerase